MDWYKTINLPSFTPAGGIIGTVWTIIFILTTISAIIVFTRDDEQTTRAQKWRIGALFIANALLNIFWSYLFFTQHEIGWATGEALILNLSVIFLIVCIWPISKTASILLLPYTAWVTFATYLSYIVYTLN